MQKGVLVFAAAVFATGCGSSTANAPRSFSVGPDEGMSDMGMSTAAPVSAPPLTEVSRADVDQVLSGGIGRFLQEVTLDAELNSGKFVGFKILRFTNREKWQGVGIEVGDVITSVNELPIERPEQAYEAFIALRGRKSLDVTYLRGDQVMRLSLPIVGERADSIPAVSTPGANKPPSTPSASGKASSDVKGASPSSKAPN